MHNVIGTEGIVIHNKKIVLGMQNEKRWYHLPNKKMGALVKTIGGKVEHSDTNSKNALLREICEEIRNISVGIIKISYHRLFEKEIFMKDLNPFDNSNLKMKAKFYRVDILSEDKLLPNDIPYLFEIPIDTFIKMDYNKVISFNYLKKYIIKSNDLDKVPDYISLFIPEEVRLYLKRSRDEDNCI